MIKPGSFHERLAAMAAREAADAGGDPDRMAEAIEGLADALAMMVAAATGGNPSGMSTMLEGASNYAFERTAHYAPVARFLAQCRRPAGDKP